MVIVARIYARCRIRRRVFLLLGPSKTRFPPGPRVWIAPCTTVLFHVHFNIRHGRRYLATRKKNSMRGARKPAHKLSSTKCNQTNTTANQRVVQTFVAVSSTSASARCTSFSTRCKVVTCCRTNGVAGRHPKNSN